jgi:hypothetical protein
MTTVSPLQHQLMRLEPSLPDSAAVPRNRRQETRTMGYGAARLTNPAARARRRVDLIHVRCPSRRFRGTSAIRALPLLAALLALPRAALAVDMIPEERVAILGVYEMECAPLKRRLKPLLTELSESLNGDRIAVLVTEKRQDLQRSGKKSWCAKARATVVRPFEQQR